MNKVGVSKPLIVANIHRVENKYDYLVTLLYENGQLLAQTITPIYQPEDIAHKLREVVCVNCDRETTFDTWTSCDLVYTQMLAESDILCELRPESDTVETTRAITDPIVLSALSDLYHVEGDKVYVKSPAKWELVLIKILNKVTDFLNGITNKLQTGKGEFK
ncbi:TPA: hypothetical protein QCV77_006269 [Bacillus thuringiensis]|nr:hypothetical protein [Bacillus thuringiensis]